MEKKDAAKTLRDARTAQLGFLSALVNLSQVTRLIENKSDLAGKVVTLTGLIRNVVERSDQLLKAKGIDRITAIGEMSWPAPVASKHWKTPDDVLRATQRAVNKITETAPLVAESTENAQAKSFELLDSGTASELRLRARAGEPELGRLNDAVVDFGTFARTQGIEVDRSQLSVPAPDLLR